MFKVSKLKSTFAEHSAGLVCAILGFTWATPAMACTAEHAAMGHCTMEAVPSKPVAESEISPEANPETTPFPQPTAAELKAAFPELGHADMHHHMHTPLIHYTLVDHLEWGQHEGENVFAWDANGWIGYDLNRFWWRTEGEREGKHTEAAELSGFYGRAIHPWWEALVGIRQDFAPDDPQTFFALGIQGLAPQWIETEITLYTGEQWHTLLRAEFEYEMLLSQRLVLTSDLELNLASHSDASRGQGSGLTDTELGLRLRYEFIREFAPYIGAHWTRKYGKTADLAESESDVIAVMGVRFWF